MALGTLEFGAPPGGTLAFGASSGGIPPADLHVDADIGALDSDITLGRGHSLVLGADIGALDAELALAWDANVSRGFKHLVRHHWQDAGRVAAGAAVHWQQSAPTVLPLAHHWQNARRSPAALAERWQDSAHHRAALASHWQDGSAVRRAAASAWQQADRRRAALASHWQDGSAVRRAAAHAWQEMERLREAIASHWQDGARVRGLAREDGRDATPVRHLARHHWQDARKPPPGRSWHTIPPEAPHLCYDPADLGKLQFGLDTSALGVLAFWCNDDGPPATVVVRPRRTYIVINSIEIRRADSGDLLPCEAFSMTLDRDSWTWSFSATFERVARDAVAPGPDGEPVELEVKVNGQPFRLQAERIGRSVRFPERLVKVSGRGRAALLDAPHAPEQSFGNAAARTAQQLMTDVLTINGVGMGWGVDWQLTDWLVPAGVWLHHGTWASALNDIAGAVGGYLQPHDTAPTLRVLPSWPAPWWEWATVTPDLELPAGIAEVEETEWIDKPAYSRVFVNGEATGGVEGNYKRAGTAGDVLKQPMVVHPLITAEAAARQRAIAELSDSGRLINQTLTLMVLPETGVIKPGTLLRYTDDDGAPRLGIVRSTAINWSFPALTQTIGVEGHA